MKTYLSRWFNRKTLLVAPLALGLALLAGTLSGSSYFGGGGLGLGGGCSNPGSFASSDFEATSRYSPNSPTADPWWWQGFFIQSTVRMCTNSATAFGPEYVTTQVFFTGSGGRQEIAPLGTAIDCVAVYAATSPTTSNDLHRSSRLTTPSYYTGGGYHTWVGRTTYLYDNWDKTASGLAQLHLVAGPDVNWVQVAPPDGLPAGAGPSSCGGSPYEPWEYFTPCVIGGSNDLTCEARLGAVVCTYDGIRVFSLEGSTTLLWREMPVHGFCSLVDVNLND